MEQILWDQYFMGQSALLSLGGTYTRLIVGVTIVHDRRIIIGGYNGSASNGTYHIDEGCYAIDNYHARIIHIEMNTVLQCAKFGAPIEGVGVYVIHLSRLQCTEMIL